VKGVEGRWAVVNITPEQARELAIEEAKKEALRKAGIGERIKSTQALAEVDTYDRSTQIFNSFSSIEMNGAVTDYVIVRDEIEKNNIDGLMYAVVVLNAKVEKYKTSPDPEFKIFIDGLGNGIYKDGTPIRFTLLPNKEGFLKIFLFEDLVETAKATLVFPNHYEPNRRFAAKETVAFPTNEIIEYTAQKSSGENMESNTLLFVYTKLDIPFFNEPEYWHILNWVNRIEPDLRDVIVKPIFITK
jgi:hypothetical protein